MTMNKMHVIHMLVYLSIKKIFESGILASGVSKVWEYIDDCANQYMCSVYVYLMNVLSY